jgi:DNA-directed RNA polymerase subunit M/transcription elongation factor TFIIS
MRCPEDGAIMVLISKGIKGTFVYVCPRCGKREEKKDHSL